MSHKRYLSTTRFFLVLLSDERGILRAGHDFSVQPAPALLLHCHKRENTGILVVKVLPDPAPRLGGRARVRLQLLCAGPTQYESSWTSGPSKWIFLVFNVNRKEKNEYHIDLRQPFHSIR